MAKPKDRRYNPGGGGGGLGTLLSTIFGMDANTVGSVEPISQPGTLIDTDTPTDWNDPETIKKVYTKAPKLDTERTINEARLYEAGNKFKVTGKDVSGKGAEIAARGNVENILSEEQAKRGIRTKESEIPIEVEREQLLNQERLKQAEALGHITNNVELQKELALTPIQVERARELHKIAVATSKGIYPEKENIEAQNKLQTNIDLSRQAEEAYESLDKARLGRENLSREKEIATKNRALGVDTAYKGAQYGNIRAQQALEEQPEEPGIRYKQGVKSGLIELAPGQSAFDVISPKKPFATAPYPTLREQAGLGNITPKIPGSAGVTKQEGAIYPDPLDPTKDIIIIGGKEIRIPKHKP